MEYLMAKGVSGRGEIDSAGSGSYFRSADVVGYGEVPPYDFKLTFEAIRRRRRESSCQQLSNMALNPRQE